MFTFCKGVIFDPLNEHQEHQVKEEETHENQLRNKLHVDIQALVEIPKKKVLIIIIDHYDILLKIYLKNKYLELLRSRNLKIELSDLDRVTDSTQ